MIIPMLYHIWIGVQEALARQERATAAAQGECKAAQHEALREHTRASELHVRCLTAEERCTALLEENIQIQAQLTQRTEELTALEAEGTTQTDKLRAVASLLDLLSGYAARIPQRQCKRPMLANLSPLELTRASPTACTCPLLA